MKKTPQTTDTGLFSEHTAVTVRDSLAGLQAVEQFQQLLNSTPNRDEIKKNPFANNAEYIPVGTIENRLDEVFTGQWSAIVTDTKIIANAVVVTLNLRVFHPVTKVWLTRSGVGANPIEVSKGASPTDFAAVTSKAVAKGAPAAKAEALKNAAKSLGVYFGRNLNREDVHYTPLTDQLNEAACDEIDTLIANCKSEVKRETYDRANPQMKIRIVQFLKANQK